MDNAQRALSPDHSVTVTASAGTGKTWLLVTRLTRLLLEGTAPDAILAITFTRKAAAEMASRLRGRLYELASGDEHDRAARLRELGLEPTPARLQTAAGLYERHLFESRQVRVTTFHAFCQELLRRFPLEADVPAGFEVLEAPRQLQETAWEALVDEATRDPDGGTAADLAQLFTLFNGHQDAKSALLRFLHHRSDWWAYVRGENDPVSFAVARLTKQLQIDSDADPVAAFFDGDIRTALQDFVNLLQRNPTDTNLKHADGILRSLDERQAPEERITDLKAAFFTKDGERLKRKANQKVLGGAAQRFLELHDRLCAKLESLVDALRRRTTLSLSRAWYHAGARLLAHYQRLKTEQRILDFSDLEWKAYTLLNHADHALWVQYKLDRRIDHLLIDEFQDTNPTQWHLIFPLLQELAAGGGERRRSVFLVGDAKQSIYRFRRADPELFPAARQWLQERLTAVDHALSSSWRSSPAVIDFVNRVFGGGPLGERLSDYPEHSTQRNELWGEVEVLPLIQVEAPEPPPAAGLRNPLQQPRTLAKDDRHRREGDLIAARIRELLAQPMVVNQGNETRALRHDDIMILVRNRNHVHAYEEALRTVGVPYVTASRGTLLECLEIRDMVALLEILILPYNNLSLAAVLRSPLFACSDEDLMRLAAQSGANWLARLLSLDPSPADTPLGRAARWLPRWQSLAGQRPVHDLLDCIYSEGNVVARYDAAFPAHLRPRLRANLTRFIELALEMDSGRYPSLTAFLNRLETLMVLEEDAPDEATENAAGSVRLLTIHAAKGLEAAVVFLADAAAPPPAARGFRELVRWPTAADRPDQFLLCGKTSEADAVTAAWLAEEAFQAQREQANLLYVALTRAKQRLFISGCAARQKRDGDWYHAIAARLDNPDTIRTQGWCDSHGAMPALPLAYQAAVASTPTPPAGLSAPLTIAPPEVEIAPSRSVATNNGNGGDEDGLERGLAIHRFLQLLAGGGQDDRAMRQRICIELNVDEQYSATWLEEARRVFAHPDLGDWFDPARYDRAFNEVPLCYYSGERLVHGVVDRLVVRGGHCALVDYKTHQHARAENLEELAAPYRQQLQLYEEGVRRLWPDKRVRAYILFTACAKTIELPLSAE